MKHLTKKPVDDKTSFVENEEALIRLLPVTGTKIRTNDLYVMGTFVMVTPNVATLNGLDDDEIGYNPDIGMHTLFKTCSHSFSGGAEVVVREYPRAVQMKRFGTKTEYFTGLDDCNTLSIGKVEDSKFILIGRDDNKIDFCFKPDMPLNNVTNGENIAPSHGELSLRFVFNDLKKVIFGVYPKANDISWRVDNFQVGYTLVDDSSPGKMISMRSHVYIPYTIESSSTNVSTTIPGSVYALTASVMLHARKNDPENNQQTCDKLPGLKDVTFTVRNSNLPLTYTLEDEEEMYYNYQAVFGNHRSCSHEVYQHSLFGVNLGGLYTNETIGIDINSEYDNNKYDLHLFAHTMIAHK